MVALLDLLLLLLAGGGNENRGDTKGKDRVYSPLFAKACPSCNYLNAHTRIFAHTLCKDLTGPLIVPWSSEAKFFFLFSVASLHDVALSRSLQS